MRFKVLGPLEVRTVTGRPVRVPEVKVRTLLANLLVHHGQVVPTVRLIEALWGGTPPANPTASLQAKVSQLRRALENAEEGARDLVVRRAPGYTLQAPQDAVDSLRFRALVARARTLDDLRARAAAQVVRPGDAVARTLPRPAARPPVEPVDTSMPANCVEPARCNRVG
ncbi:winged helix-turn-helix domain-containing protein [Streptomyces diastatochromogenes]|uniref:AfsR/SARP family transcriptional regulator n=1 Tax=Streptomyces diastatochromogenes TaxID=42236 RepID=UPI00365EB14A